MSANTRVVAVLGPTNTGKTYRAVERMLEHESGIIGLPLRLLAREVYDRVRAKAGDDAVALVTGEEKRVPRGARYWVCTTEAMPTTRVVDFACVDEVQLAAHEQRGHTFTDRLLHMRGRIESWFLGSRAMRPIVSALLPHAEHHESSRLSQLSYVPPQPLFRTPPRSAIVAFSLPQVYELAERIRNKKGGAAVVTGALSPRTRNAQVELFQSGEVDYMIATDAIGMGLNLDVSHVAFTRSTKFDGRETRELELGEIGQIAGRAGRYTKDGTFSTVAPLELPIAVVRAVEQHRFPDVQRLYFRTSEHELDLSSLDALSASLRTPPRHPALTPMKDALDERILAMAARTAEVQRVAHDADAVALLWSVCKIPDYRALLLESHVAFCLDVWRELLTRGALDDTWMQARLVDVGLARGDVDELTAKVAHVRHFTFIAHEARWVANAATWQARTRALEDDLSDALHRELVERFVDARARSRNAVPAAPSSSPFAALERFRSSTRLEDVATEPDVDPLTLVSADDLVVRDDGCIIHASWGTTLGQLTPGTSLPQPNVKLHPSPRVNALDATAAATLRATLLRAARAVPVRAYPLLEPLAQSEHAALRGVAHALYVGLGTVPRATLAGDLAQHDAALREAHIAVGALFVRKNGRSETSGARAALVHAFYGIDASPLGAAPPHVRISARDSCAPDAAWLALGYARIGESDYAVRIDVLEQLWPVLHASPAPSEAYLQGQVAFHTKMPTVAVRAFVEQFTSLPDH